MKLCDFYHHHFKNVNFPPLILNHFKYNYNNNIININAIARKRKMQQKFPIDYIVLCIYKYMLCCVCRYFILTEICVMFFFLTRL